MQNSLASELEQRRRIGLFGGTFDPIHIGHLVMAAEAREALDLDEIRMEVAGDPWQKSNNRQVTSAEVRFAMVEAAVGNRSWLTASRIEIDRGGPTYTIDTVQHFLEVGCDVTVLVGVDAANGLATWHRISELVKLCRFAVLSRPGAVLGQLPSGCDFSVVDSTQMNVASADLRSKVARGTSIDFVVPDPVIQIIRRESLYGGLTHD